jgi:5-methyltetrahydrofolate--homocysteine methyltransferase
MLKEIVNGRKLQANGVAAFYPANSVGDDIEVYEDEDRSKTIGTYMTLRQQVRIRLLH